MRALSGRGDLAARRRGFIPLALTVLATATVGCEEPERSRRVSAGVAHACDLADGVVRCWGDDRRGQLGRGAPSEAPAAPAPVELPRVRAIDAGGDTTCAVDEAGALWCFGGNRHGQLGDASREARAAPFAVPGLPPVVDVSVGFEHVCARDADGGVWCWGWNGTGQSAPGGPLDVDAPTRVADVPPAVDVVAGYADTCLTTDDARVFCWGVVFGAPMQVASGARAVAIGADHVCVVRASELRCFGAPPGGARPPLPEEGVGLALDGGEVAAGAVDHVCVTDASGAVRCLGKNEDGQIGDGTLRFADAPTPVRGLDGPADDVTVGHEHSCAAVRGGTHCWGANELGQLGDIGAPASLDAVPVP